MSFWEIESPRFAVQGPEWLKIDERTGVLSGIPDKTGKIEITVTATIDREGRKLDERQLAWGSEKIVSTAAQRVGSATKKFFIIVE